MRNSVMGVLGAVVAGCAAAAVAQGFVLSRTRLEVNVNVSVTDAGRARALPTKEQPAYYLPVMGGYLERGENVAGETPPERKLITDHLALELAKQHYFVMGPGRDPSVILVFHWGYLVPPMPNHAAGVTVPDGRAEALILVGGSSLDKLGIGPEQEEISRASLENRYFLIVTAYDYAAATRKEKVLLWRARMSAPSDGIMMSDAVPSLIKSGAPQFGRETEEPVWEQRKFVRDGKVEPGEITVIEDDVKPPAAPAPKR